MSLRACEAVSNFQDEIACPSLRLSTLRSRSSLLCHCELVKQSHIFGMRLLTLRCAWARYAVVPRNDRCCWRESFSARRMAIV